MDIGVGKEVTIGCFVKPSNLEDEQKNGDGYWSRKRNRNCCWVFCEAIQSEGWMSKAMDHVIADITMQVLSI